jgi:hypothetical protein
MDREKSFFLWVLALFVCTNEKSGAIMNRKSKILCVREK